MILITFLIGLINVLGVFSDRPSESTKKLLIRELSAASVDCFQVHPINFAEVGKLKRYQLPNSDGALCFLECIMEKAGLVNLNGELILHNVIDTVRRINDNEPQRVQEATDLIEKCIHDIPPVNRPRSHCGNRALLTCLLHQLGGGKRSLRQDDYEEISISAGVIFEDKDPPTTEIPQQKTFFQDLVDNVMVTLVNLVCAATAENTVTGKFLSIIPGSWIFVSLCSLVTNNWLYISYFSE